MWIATSITMISLNKFFIWHENCFRKNDGWRICLRIPRIKTHRKGIDMNVTLSTGPIVALIAGILILIIPRLLNYIIALYLIVVGVLGLMGAH